MIIFVLVSYQKQRRNSRWVALVLVVAGASCSWRRRRIISRFKEDTSGGSLKGEGSLDGESSHVGGR
ncbi:unnamed protein product [Coffea canephora]|uniref:Uncharacterized protein n=1 Tax=Coffea canephora TaxID=49390 RepID=A0A068UFC4_COFCA|nr:unnamed protein product [Coffea canephora]